MVGRRLWLRAVPHLLVSCGNMKQPRAPSRALQTQRPLRWDRTLYEYVCQLLDTYKNTYIQATYVQSTCIYICFPRSHLPHMSIRSSTYRHTCVFYLHLCMGGPAPRVTVSRFRHGAHFLVTELTWDLKSGRRRAGKALVRCVTVYAQFCCVV